MKNFTKIILFVLSLSLTLIAKDVATITGVNGKAFIERDGAKIAVIIGTTLQEKDSVITNDKAKVQIIFTDETIVTIGKNSNFSISEYLFEDDQEPVVKFAMLKGAMRTITGKIGKIAPDKFTVTAKTATIGIRGTNFSVIVGDNDNTEVYCTYGAISVTVNGNENIVNQGFFIILLPDGKVETKEFKPKNLKEMKKKFAKSTTKTGTVDDDSIPSNEAVVDNTVENFDNVLIKDISNNTVDAEQLDLNLADIIAGYTMSDAVYSGTYQLTQNKGNVLSDGKSATMNVDFGNDKITLLLEGVNGTRGVGKFTSNSTIGTNFNLSQVNTEMAVGAGTADGSFTGETGNNANGSFILISGEGATDKGTFDVTSTQTLN